MSASKPPLGVMIRAHLLADPRKTAVLAILALVMLGVYARILFKPKAVEAEPAAVSILPTTVVNAEKSAPSADHRLERVSINRPMTRELIRDPFVPTHAILSAVAQNDDEEKPLVLQSTICGPAPMACINGTFLKPGQKIYGYVLQRVENTSVVLRKGNAQLELLLSN